MVGSPVVLFGLKPINNTSEIHTTTALEQIFEHNKGLLNILIKTITLNYHSINSFHVKIQRHIALLNQISKCTWTNLVYFMELELFFKSITSNLDASDGEYFTESINRLNQGHLQIEKPLKNHISVTTSFMQNFRLTNYDKIMYVQAKLSFLESCEKLMENYLYLEENFNNVLKSITFARLKNLHT